MDLGHGFMKGLNVFSVDIEPLFVNGPLTWASRLIVQLERK